MYPNAEYSISYPNGREYKITMRDLLDTPVDAIVNPANSGLSHGGGLAARISDEAGPELDDECGRILKKAGGIIPVTYALPTKAYNLSYKGIIHAVGPIMGDGDEGKKIEKTIKHSLIAADYKKWKSVAFPAVSTGLFRVPKEVCAEAFKTTVPDYWENNPDSGIETVWLCLVKEDYDIFRRIIS